MPTTTRTTARPSRGGATCGGARGARTRRASWTTVARGAGGYLDYAAALSKEFTSVELPSLLFPRAETLLPGSAMTLHLYEARFLALLDAARANTGGLIAQLTYFENESGEEGLRVNSSATLARIEWVKREAVGATVRVAGEARVKLEGVVSREPYITGVYTHVPQMGDVGTYVPSDAELAQVREVTDYIENAVRDVMTLSDRLNGDASASAAEGEGEDEEIDGMWTHKEVGDLRTAMRWVDAPAITIERIETPISMEDADWSRADGFTGHSELARAERLSFAVLQVAPASTPSALRTLISCRAVAMSAEHGLMDRLRLCVSVLEDQLNTLRAKVALKSTLGG
ncbi:Peptidase S16, lon N-terminal [Ostreococcus tauri]|uniref:Peptidase S16, lon N-terminal n=1 Tax=Ostreococcus tauri TaxID=70448 RepID=A0A090M624_OSTTA|nr:Peptidase S16, lon N-terminal [Ostreococcus tauri]CEF97569.1 Peptidase S16, lon N-terminal [Ostreococcus tauri]|eukprot:XP_003078772.2 Peptidase S16, lon N-terminal [Ostreococcus tauri]